MRAVIAREKDALRRRTHPEHQSRDWSFRSITQVGRRKLAAILGSQAVPWSAGSWFVCPPSRSIPSSVASRDGSLTIPDQHGCESL